MAKYKRFRRRKTRASRWLIEINVTLIFLLTGKLGWLERLSDGSGVS